MKILVVEDEQDIRELISRSLTQAGYELRACADVASAQRLVNEFLPDCLVVDWMLADSSGVELIRWLRRQQDLSGLPVLMLTARSQESDKILGLDAGADDYMTKPMSLRELQARVRALLRRSVSYQPQTELIIAGVITLNSASHQVTIREQPVEFSRTEYRLLKYLMEQPDRVLSRDQLLSAVWGDNVYLDDRTVDVHILRLRKILRQYSLDVAIKTVRGEGYRFARQSVAED